MSNRAVLAAARGQTRWLNHATWIVLRWLVRDKPSDRYWRAVAQRMKAFAPDSRYTWDYNMGLSEAAACELADTLQTSSENGSPEIGPTMHADLLRGALAEVDWLAIAFSLLEELDEQPETSSAVQASGRPESPLGESEGKAT